MKYTERRIKRILDELKKGTGRVNAVKKAGIHYDTFCEWMKRYPEFSERVINAEEQGEQVRIEFCENALLTAQDWRAQRDYLWLKHWRRFKGADEIQNIRVIYERGTNANGSD